MANPVQNPTEMENFKCVLDSVRTILKEKRQVNKKLEQDIERLRARKSFLINLKMESAVNATALPQPSFTDYFCMIDEESQKIIQYIRAQSSDKESKINSYLEQYKTFQNELKSRIEQPESFDEYTHMFHDELQAVHKAEVNSGQVLIEAIKAEKLNVKEINNACEANLAGLSDETEQLKSYLDELKAAKK